MQAKLVRHRFAPGGKEVRLTKTWVPDETGELAIRFATHFGVVAATHGGEDSKGRAQLVLQSPKAVVKRSCKMAELLVKEMREKGWVVDLPDPPEEEEEPAKPAVSEDPLTPPSTE